MKNSVLKTTIALALLLTAFTFAADSLSVETASAAADTAKSTGIYTRIIDWYNDNLNYGTITLLMAIESSFIPFPSELVVPPAAYKALQPGSGLNIALIVFFATLGALIGAYVNYYLAKILGRPIIYKFAECRKKDNQCNVEA